MNRLGLASYSLVGFGAFLILLPGHAYAACNQWDMPTKTGINQSNDTVIWIKTVPSEGGFIGSAEYQSVADQAFGADIQYVSGRLEGAVDGSNVHFTIHWGKDWAKGNDHATGVYTGTIGPQGRLTGTAYKAENAEETANWWADENLVCHVADPPPPTIHPLSLGHATPPVPLGRKQVPPAVPLGRRQVATPLQPPICESARSARARGSPAAPGLEKQCAAAGGPLPQPVAGVPIGAVQPPICESARSARARGSPVAPNLEKQCEAAGGPIATAPVVETPVPEPVEQVEQAPDPMPPSGSSAICEAASEARDGGLPSAARLEALCRGDGAANGGNASAPAIGSGPSSSSPEMRVGRARYRATLRITSDTCPFNDFSTTNLANIEAIITPSQLNLPLPLFRSIFDRPVNLNRTGESLSYDGLIAITAGMMPPEAPARFYAGRLDANLSSFEVRFDITGLCTISGMVMGSRI